MRNYISYVLVLSIGKLFPLRINFLSRYKKAMKSLTTKEAAEKLGITPQRVRTLIRAGRLPAEKFGRDLVIQEEDLKLVKERKPGRPKKQPSKNGGLKK